MSKKDEGLRRVRLGELKRVLRHRYGPVLPDDDAGREDLHELLLPISLGKEAGRKMENAIEVWAPWMRADEAQSKMSINPMQRAHAAPRCRAKRTGKPCRAPAVRGWKVCRLHGARGGAPEGKRNGNYRHGARTKEAINAARAVNLLVKLARGR